MSLFFLPMRSWLVHHNVHVSTLMLWEWLVAVYIIWTLIFTFTHLSLSLLLFTIYSIYSLTDRFHNNEESRFGHVLSTIIYFSILFFFLSSVIIDCCLDFPMLPGCSDVCLFLLLSVFDVQSLLTSVIKACLFFSSTGTQQVTPLYITHIFIFVNINILKT